jgi:hypothetical protein
MKIPLSIKKLPSYPSKRGRGKISPPLFFNNLVLEGITNKFPLYPIKIPLSIKKLPSLPLKKGKGDETPSFSSTI